jgi:hypothetical protein
VNIGHEKQDRQQGYQHDSMEKEIIFINDVRTKYIHMQKKEFGFPSNTIYKN